MNIRVPVLFVLSVPLLAMVLGGVRRVDSHLPELEYAGNAQAFRSPFRYAIVGNEIVNPKPAILRMLTVMS